ncbi:MAG: type restriction enzyme subunit, partial [Acidimicrobiaceae bacterium]|nr:type restriction enzyme subunit [Acidimicrobiaceae bacterium]
EVSTIYSTGGGQFDPNLEPLSQIIATLNERYGTSWQAADRVFCDVVAEKLAARPDIQQQAAANSADTFALVMQKEFLAGVVGQLGVAEDMAFGARYPSCIGGRRACPPEDCGAPWGYLEFLEAIKGPAPQGARIDARVGRRPVRSGGVRPRRLPTAPRSRAPGVTVARLFRRVPPGVPSDVRSGAVGWSNRGAVWCCLAASPVGSYGHVKVTPGSCRSRGSSARTCGPPLTSTFGRVRGAPRA